MPALVPLHLGALHPAEQALTLVLAFGPFAVLGLVIALRRRAERREDAAAGLDVDQDADQAER